MNSLTGLEQWLEIADVALKNFIITLRLQRLNIKKPQRKMFS